MYSHCELSLPSAGDQLSELDHVVDESEFLSRDLKLESMIDKAFCHFGTEQGGMGAQCTMSTRSGFLGELDCKRKRPLHQQVLAHVGCDELIPVCGV